MAGLCICLSTQSHVQQTALHLVGAVECHQPLQDKESFADDKIGLESERPRLVTGNVKVRSWAPVRGAPVSASHMASQSSRGLTAPKSLPCL